MDHRTNQGAMDNVSNASKAMDQWACSGAMVVACALNWRHDGCYMRWTEGVMDVSSDGSWRNPRSDWSRSKLSITLLWSQGDRSKWEQAMDQTIKGWMVDGSVKNWSMDGSGSNRIKRRMVHAMEYWAIVGAMDGGSDGSVSKWRRDGHYKRHNWRCYGCNKRWFMEKS